MHKAHRAAVRKNKIQASDKATKTFIEVDTLEHGPITPEDILYGKTIRTIHCMCVKQIAPDALYALLELQFQNGADISFDHAHPGYEAGAGGIFDWLQAGANVFLRMERARAKNTVMAVLFPYGVPFSMAGDGSSDLAMREWEAVANRFIGPDGRPFNTFADLAELDLETSVDKHSPDAQCITACYAKSLDAYNTEEGFLLFSEWRKAMCHVSFDGASVMLGILNGVAAKLGKMVRPQCPHATTPPPPTRRHPPSLRRRHRLSSYTLPRT